jgi:aspartate aminotransferase
MTLPQAFIQGSLADADIMHRHHHGLALFLLQGADDKLGIACLGGECFGEAGAGFLRFSCAEPNDRLEKALEFIPTALARTDRLQAWLAKNPSTGCASL